ncbi:MAG TPA: MaoC/PaaZ C-terminal domain-containing protein [Acidimicrobiia bacterium]
MATTWDDLIEGDTGPPPLVVGPVTVTDSVRYQGASGDMQPIHHDAEFAARAGYDAPLTVGMFQAGLLTTWATDWLGPEHLRRSRVRWKAQVWPGDVLTCAGRVVRKYEEAGEHKVDLEVAGKKQDGSVAVQGWMTFVVPA